MSLPTTTIPVSSESSLFVTAGSIATIICFSSFSVSLGNLASSINLLVHKAPSRFSIISAYNSCLPKVVPSYLSLNIANALSARLASFSNVFPVVTATSSLATKSLIILVGFGVVVIRHCGFLPSLSPNISWSNASGYLQAATSSHHALWNCGPLNRSGSDAAYPTILLPLCSLISFMLDE